MKAALLALLVAISTSVWSYSRLQGHTGYGNAKTTVKGAAIVFVIAFVVVFTIGLMVLH
jgi:hypothetical protein